jgi:hypothetical protein
VLVDPQDAGQNQGTSRREAGIVTPPPAERLHGFYRSMDSNDTKQIDAVPPHDLD